ncbi:MAG: hypothetical protein LUC88_06340 [Prevotella sp.]|nr:hypothetical protein [Prevotella sp.]
MIVTVIIGLVVWFVVPILTNDALKKKSQKKAAAMLCRIIGMVIIVAALIKYITSLLS